MTVDQLAASRRRRRATYWRRLVILGFAVLALVAIGLMVGRRFYPPAEVLGVILGEDIPGASYTVVELRVPRMILGAGAGAAFGMAGVTYQTMLRNSLASPDVVGISAGAGASAVVAILVFDLTGFAVSALAIVGALLTALTIYLLSYRGGVSGTRLILIGIGIAAMLNAVTSYLLVTAAAWDLSTAMRWLTGSLNGADWHTVGPFLLAVGLLFPILLSQQRSIGLLAMGDDVARALGVHTERTRLVAVLGATALVAVATAAAGPVLFVAFMAGPIAMRMFRWQRPLIPAALIGALLVLAADLAGAFAFSTRYPVGVVTGVLGAPFLIVLLSQANRAGRYR